jgi:CRISPR-associated protein Cas4
MSDTPTSQPELPLPFPELARDLPLLPARMLNEHQYCPRLAYLEWVQGEWADSADTVEGRRVHRRVDKPSGELPPADELPAEEKLHARSITLSSNRLGLIAKMDLVEAEDGFVVPVDYKRGKRPHVAGGAYDPERVQLCAQALILDEHGYRVREGALYFAASRERVAIAASAHRAAACARQEPGRDGAGSAGQSTCGGEVGEAFSTAWLGRTRGCQGPRTQAGSIAGLLLAAGGHVCGRARRCVARGVQ